MANPRTKNPWQKTTQTKTDHMPTTPFSPAELAEFKGILDAKLTEAEADLQLLKDELASDATDKGITTEETTLLITRQGKFIHHLHNAMARIANRTYGICRVTGQPISKERLRLVPHATLSLEARDSVRDKAKPSSELPAS